MKNIIDFNTLNGAPYFSTSKAFENVENLNEILAVLTKNNRPMRVKEIREDIGLTTQCITSYLKLLIELGYLTRSTTIEGTKIVPIQRHFDWDTFEYVVDKTKEVVNEVAYYSIA